MPATWPNSGALRETITRERIRFLRNAWPLVALEKQLDGRSAANWLLTGGRGAGKTRTGAEWVNALVFGRPPYSDGAKYRSIALVGETYADVREVMIDGPSGIRATAVNERPRYEVTRRRLVWENGAVAQAFSSENFEALRGPQFDAAWCDELGCPAIDKGPNQPNIFPDPKSSEGGAPYFSTRGRCDMAQTRFLAAHFAHWDPASASFSSADNPASPHYAGRMADHERAYVWAWDARPFPAFPLRSDEWSDGANWTLGHWLNGRIVGAEVGDVINAVLADHGLPPADVTAAEGSVHGFVVDEPTTARSALEPLVDLFGLAVAEEANRLVVSKAGARNAAPLEIDELVVEENSAVLEMTRPGVDELPVDAVLGFANPMREYQAGSVAARRLGAAGRRKATTSFPGTLEPGQAQLLLDDWLARKWFERDVATFNVPAGTPGIEPGDVVRLPGSTTDFLVQEIEDGLLRKVSARKVLRGPPSLDGSEIEAVAPKPTFAGRPLAVLLDLPLMPGQTLAQDQLRLAVRQSPWRPQAIFVSPGASGYARRGTAQRRATMGRLKAALAAGIEGRIDLSNAVDVELFDGELSSVERTLLLNGANAAAVQSVSGAWELLQFESAEEIAANRWRLTWLLRGQLGTDNAMRAGAAAGALFVLLDGAASPVGLNASEVGLTLNWRVGPSGAAFTDTHFVTLTEAGGVRAKVPLSPVHISGVVGAGGLDLSWTRRSRVDADDWDSDEIPLGEDTEQYRVRAFSTGGALKRTVTVTAPAWTYSNPQITADFGVSPPAIDIEIRQIGTGGRLGEPRTARIALG